jgi:nitronate monooxygenase
MYPCGNPELVAAVSEAGGIGVVQPLSLTYVYKHDFREGLRHIRRLTSKPIGFNALIEASSKVYLDRMRRFTDIAVEEGVRFFVTALGNPDWVVEKVHASGGLVYHDVTDVKWARKALDAGVDGFIAVNGRAGGHAGTKTPEALLEELRPLGKPIVCAGGVGDEAAYVRMMKLGYEAVQMGTRFVAATECRASEAYKNAILEADEDDIALTERLTGVPVSVILTPYVEKIGLKAGPLARLLLKNPRTKHWMRLYYSLKSFRDLQRSINKPKAYDEYWQAGKSAAAIHSVEPAGEIVRRFGEAWAAAVR